MRDFVVFSLPIALLEIVLYMYISSELIAPPLELHLCIIFYIVTRLLPNTMYTLIYYICRYIVLSELFGHRSGLG
jgi:hypothetical protein